MVKGYAAHEAEAAVVSAVEEVFSAAGLAAVAKVDGSLLSQNKNPGYLFVYYEIVSE